MFTPREDHFSYERGGEKVRRKFYRGNSAIGIVSLKNKFPTALQRDRSSTSAISRNGIAIGSPG